MLPFQVIRSPAKMRALAEDQRRDGQRIAVVPTMGFLHDGHLELLRVGRGRCDLLVLTLFVNPTQFAPGEDLDRYPRNEDADLAHAQELGVNIAFCPSVSDMYPDGYQTSVQVSELAAPLCGAGRPGHFSGVASVVTKLFHLTQPHVGVFGQKDYQQLAIIRRMVRDLDFDIDIVGVPIVREADGLALSSRNSYLSTEQRSQATCLYRGLSAARSAWESGARSAKAVLGAARSLIANASLCELEYLELRDANTLEPVAATVPSTATVVLAVAARFGTTRLIDNVVLLS